MKITLENLAKLSKTPATWAKTLTESPIRKFWWTYKLNKLLPTFISETNKLHWKFVIRNVDKYINPLTGSVIDVNYGNAQVIIKSYESNPNSNLRFEYEFLPSTSTILWINGIHKGVYWKYNFETKTWDKE